MSLPAGLFAPPIAHRGLWSRHRAPENSLTAIRAAAESGYGAEFDIRLTADGVPVVFHDADLERMTGAAGALADRSLAELSRLRLAGCAEAIPTLRQTLEAAADAFLLIELKAPADPAVLGPAVAAELDHFLPPCPSSARCVRRSCAVISFDPALLAWFARERPDIPRGLDYAAAADPAALRAAIEAAYAQFLVLELPLALGPIAATWRGQGWPVIAWTARTPDDAARARAVCDNLIFEGLRP